MFGITNKITRTITHTRNIINYIYRQRSDFLSSPYPTIEIPNAILPEFLFQWFDKYPNQIAMECDFTGKKYTFDDLRLKSRNFNTNLRIKLNLRKGDVIAILLPNVADYPICVFGAFQAGLIVTTINPYYTSEEISRQIIDANVKAIVTLSSLYDITQKALKDLKMSIPILTVKTKTSNVTPEGGVDLNEFTQTNLEVNDTVDIHAEDVALLLYSSGTTGLPKGAEHTHQSIVANICQINNENLQYYPSRSEIYENRQLAILPWFHVFGIVFVLFSQLRLLTKIICAPKFTPKSFLDMLIKHNPTGLHLVPPLISFLATNPSVKREFLQSISTVVYGAAPLNTVDLHTFVNKINKKINLVEVYGLTETIVSCTTAPSSNAKGELGTLQLVPNTLMKIVSPENYNVGLNENEIGEILIKGPQLMKGYYNRSSETKNAFFNKWFKTGDLGYYDENGSVYLTSRLKDIIKVNSFQVAPVELEEIIRRYKNVADVAVIGIPDKQYGEVPLAIVVLAPNAKLNITDLQKFVSNKVANYKQLRGGVIIVDSLPKSATGKILRKDLLLMYKNNTL
ncbi:hypothetical protein RN001_003369 [Aquatica leii]|uniref:4-coumarate--CoA ligase n=1 Tax=Aquatica leii TaxID=1421715 RepID=A0AAN7SRK3_9COLE|nr:hypothetical protein RN001_003369 [Aquatica leii]